MDSADETEEQQNRYLFDEEDEDNGPSGNRDDEAEEVPAPDAPKVIKPKRVILNPQPKLDAVRLMGPRGIGIIQSTFRGMKFKGKGHEKEDLNMFMKKLEHWAHRLFPKMPFDDCLTQIEKLGTKKPVQNMVKRIRLDMFQSDEMTSSQDPPPGDADAPREDKAPEIDVFDELLGTGAFAYKNSADAPMDNAPVSIPSSQPPAVSTLTSDQRERMERNRRLALERRKLKQQKEAELRAASVFPAPDDPSMETSIPDAISGDLRVPPETTESLEDESGLSEEQLISASTLVEASEETCLSKEDLCQSKSNQNGQGDEEMDATPNIVTEDDILSLVNNEKVSLRKLC